MQNIKNVLFIMSDQLRWDYLSCYGHPVLKTPNIDALAARGVRFDAAYVQSGVCVPSRMSYYTGRYMSSHGAAWNYVPLSVMQTTFGDFLESAQREVALTGKTHVIPDYHGIAQMGLNPTCGRGAYLKAGGFLEFDRYDGHAMPGPESGYAAYLRAHGYVSDDPWSEYVIGATDAQGKFASGWFLRNAHLPARVDSAHSETAYMTQRAIDYIRDKGNAPWVLHLSYIKPHWPLMAPAPYHAMYRDADTGPIVGKAKPRCAPHPVLEAYRNTHEDCLTYGREDVVRHVRPTYMGLIKELDDQIGRLMGELAQLGALDNTLIVFCSDHGDYLGDHGLGEKELFYEQAIRVPMIIVDPRQAADATRGTAQSHFVEAIDILPTMLDALGIETPDHVIEGHSLLPLLHAGDSNEAPRDWRDCVFSELDYSFRDARRALGRRPDECYAWMARTRRWKYVHYQGMRAQLFDLQEDPLELEDLGDAPAYAGVRRGMRERLLEWRMRLKWRTGISNAAVERGTEGWKALDMQIGVW